MRTSPFDRYSTRHNFKSKSMETDDNFSSFLRPKNENRLLSSAIWEDKKSNKDRIDNLKTSQNDLKLCDLIKYKENKNIKSKIDSFTSTIRKEKNYYLRSYKENAYSNIQFEDTRSSNYILSFLPRFKSICKIKKYADAIYNKDLSIKTSKSSFLNVYDKVKSYKDYFEVRGVIDANMRKKIK